MREGESVFATGACLCMVRMCVQEHTCENTYMRIYVHVSVIVCIAYEWVMCCKLA